MKHLMFVLAGLAACSQGREQRAPATDNAARQPDLTLPDTLARRDSSVVLSSRGEQPVSPVEQQAPKAQPQPAKTHHLFPSHRQRTIRTTKPPAARPATPPADTSVRAYAPNVTDSTPALASAATADSAISDSTRLTATDTVAAPAPDTVSARPADSVTAQPVDSATSGDTVATRVPDTSTTVRDTAATASHDTATAASVAVAPTPSAAGTTPAAARTLPIGTEIHAALDDSITSRRDTVGQQISAHVMENVTGADGRTLIAAGTPVQFTVTRLRASRSKGSQGRLALRADGFTVNGQLQPVEAEVRPVPRELRGRGVTGSDAAKVGGGAAAGAVLGRVVGGNTKGAVIGGVAGAAAGAVVATQTSTRDVVVKAKTPVVLVLTAPLVAP
jgi:hypothetical protein